MTILIILFGLMVGSFLNLCICRIPKNKKLSLLISHCQSCQSKLGLLDQIPLLSYIYLRGRCRYCGEHMSIQYPLIEATNSIAYFVVFKLHGLNLETALGWVFISTIIVLTMIDIQEMILPTKVVLFGSAWCIFLKATISFINQNWSIVGNSLLAGLLGYCSVNLFFWLSLKILKKEGIGYGDVRYLGMIGLFTSPVNVGLALFIGGIVGSIYGIILYYRNNRQSMYFALGPFLSIGALITYFKGDDLLVLYSAWLLG